MPSMLSLWCSQILPRAETALSVAIIFSAARDEGKLIVAFNPARAAAKKVDEMVNIIPPKNKYKNIYYLAKENHQFV